MIYVHYIYAIYIDLSLCKQFCLGGVYSHNLLCSGKWKRSNKSNLNFLPWSNVTFEAIIPRPFPSLTHSLFCPSLTTCSMVWESAGRVCLVFCTILFMFRLSVCCFCLRIHLFSEEDQIAKTMKTLCIMFHSSYSLEITISCLLLSEKELLCAVHGRNWGGAPLLHFTLRLLGHDSK